ncbi:MAG: AIR synthase related protein [Thermoplasmata archaeon]
MNIDELVQNLRTHPGVTRKAEVSAVANELLTVPEGIIVATHGEDAAAIELDGRIILLAADGIMEDLVKANPYWAGYCSVLVNVNDIAAMGGSPLAIVDVLSCGDPHVRSEIVSGMRAASEKTGVPIVGGHLHPDASYCAVDVAVLGETDKQHLILSSGASSGDTVIFAMDLDGHFTPGIPYSWDTTSAKDSGAVRRGVMSMHAVGSMVSAGKDISSPGALGTLGMLLEASACGAKVDVGAIPRPDDVDLLQWLKAYQGCGFVVTSADNVSEKVVAELGKRGLTAAVCGQVEAGSRLVVEMGRESAELFDLSVDTLGCRPPQRI